MRLTEDKNISDKISEPSIKCIFGWVSANPNPDHGINIQVSHKALACHRLGRRRLGSCGKTNETWQRSSSTDSRGAPSIAWSNITNTLEYYRGSNIWQLLTVTMNEQTIAYGNPPMTTCYLL